MQLVSALSNANRKQKGVQTKLNKLSEAVDNLVTLTSKHSKVKVKWQEDLQRIKESLDKLGANVKQLSVSKVFKL